MIDVSLKAGQDIRIRTLGPGVIVGWIFYRSTIYVGYISLPNDELSLQTFLQEMAAKFGLKLKPVPWDSRIFDIVT